MAAVSSAVRSALRRRRPLPAKPCAAIPCRTAATGCDSVIWSGTASPRVAKTSQEAIMQQAAGQQAAMQSER